MVFGWTTRVIQQKLQIMMIMSWLQCNHDNSNLNINISTSEPHVNFIIARGTDGTPQNLPSPGPRAFGFSPLIHLRCQRPAPSPGRGETCHGAGYGLHGAAHVPRPGPAVRRGLPGCRGADAHAPRGAQRVLCRTGVLMEDMEVQCEFSSGWEDDNTFLYTCLLDAIGALGEAGS